MKEALLEELLPQVRRNCLISDARFWGYYSVCGLLLRLRSLYMFEKGISPGGRTERADVLRWIEKTEALWDEMKDRDFTPIRVNSTEFDPFDAESINRAVSEHGLLYCAGYGMYLKPVFFISDLDSTETIGGLRVFTAGKEYARDLSIHPAMLQAHTVIARKYATLVLICEKFEEFRAQKGAGALGMAFSSYGITGSSSALELEKVAEGELRTFIHHEIGEALETEKTGNLWTRMLSQVAHRKASFFIRSVKDTLADTSEKGMLRNIIDERKTGSLAFYVASLSGFRKTLGIEVDRAFREFAETGNWEVIESARARCYSKTMETAAELLALYTEDAGQLYSAIERHISLMCSRNP